MSESDKSQQQRTASNAASTDGGLLAGREVLIGVTGGIAAYKTAMLVSRLRQSGAGVSVIMTRSATELVGPKTFEALSGRPVRVETFGEGGHHHIELGREAELFCIAPATANILAKAATGLADDLLSTAILAFEGPTIFAPAMNSRMWNKPAVQRNIKQLRTDGYIMAEPGEGWLSCGESGAGRMAEPEVLLELITAKLGEIGS